MDHYLPKGGSLGFVITQSIFKSGACEGFRRFSLEAARPLQIERVCDMSLCLPFEGAINRTATIIVRKGRATRYPVSYKMWIPRVPRSIVPEDSLEDVEEQFAVRDWLAAPVEPSVAESPWLTAEKKAFPVLQKVIGDRSKTIMDRAYAGTCTWLNGVYWLEEVKSDSKGILIRNLADVGRNKVQSVTKQVEADFLYPLLRGRDVQAWNAKSTLLIAVPHDPANFSQPLLLSQLGTKYPLTYSFFKDFEEPLRKRSGYKQLLKSRARVLRNRKCGRLHALTLQDRLQRSDRSIPMCGSRPSKSQPKGSCSGPHSALLNFGIRTRGPFHLRIVELIPVRVALYGASVGVQTQRYFPTDVSRVKIPEFRVQDKVHQAIVRLSRDCHEEAATSRDTQILESLEAKLLVAVAGLWGISPKETVYLTRAYEEIQSFRKKRGEDEEEVAE